MNISKKVYLFNIFLLSFLGFEVLYSSFLISNSSSNAYLLLIAIYLLSIFLISLFPIKNFNIAKITNKNNIFKIILTIYLILYISLIVSYSTTILNHWFYHKTPIYVILTVLLISIFIISNSIKFIYNIGALLGLFITLNNLIPIFNSIPRTFDFLFNINVKLNIFLIITSVITFLDLLLELFYSSLLKDKLRKIDFIITISLSFIFSLVLMLENYFFFNSNFLNSSYNPNYLKYKIYFINDLIDNIDIILLLNILFFSIFKCSKYLNLIKLINNFKMTFKDKFSILSNFILLIIFFLISNSIINVLTKNRLLIKNYIIVLNILIILIYIFLNIKLRSKKDETKLLSTIN